MASKKIDISLYKEAIYNNDFIFYKGLCLQPILIKDYEDFIKTLVVLKTEKNELGQPEFVRMSELEFLVTMCAYDKRFYDGFLILMNLVSNLNEEDIIFDTNEDGKIVLKIKNVIYDKNDYLNIKRIICYQNLYEYDDEYFDPTFKKAIEDSLRLMSKNSIDIPFGSQKSAVSILTGLTDKEINHMPIIKFYDIYNKSLALVDYKLAKASELMGNKFKQPIEHWLYQDRESRIRRMITTQDDLNSFGLGSIEDVSSFSPKE